MSYLTLTIKDQEQPVSYVGKLIHKSANRVKFETKFGIMDLPVNDLIELKQTTEEQYNQTQGPVKEKEQPVVESTRQYGHREGNSKFNQAVTIYRSMMVDGQHPKRSDVITAFVEQVGMTPAGASTYQQNVKKHLS